MVGEVGFPTTVVSSRKSSAAREEAPPAARDAGGSDGPPSLWRDVLQSVTAGLLSSSCCALQLGLNLLSAFDVVHVGCAGFNKVLGPLRGVLRGVTAAWLSWLWYRVQFSAAEPPHKSARRTSLRNRLVFQTAITVALMFLPETLKIMGGPSVALNRERSRTGVCCSRARVRGVRNGGHADHQPAIGCFVVLC